MKSAALAALVILAAPLVPSASAQRGSETVQVTLVEVPVTVVDRNGAAVRGLTAKNFELFDDGKPREVTSFEAVDLSAGAAAAAATAAASPASPVGEQAPHPTWRNFMLLFDVSDSTPATLNRAREAAQAFVEKLQPGDRLAVGTVSLQGGFRLLANFTLDREFVRAVVATLGDPKQFRTRDPLMLAARDFDLSADSTLALSSLDTKVSGKAAMAAEQAKDLAREQRKTAREEQRAEILRRIQNLSELGKILDRVAGRKQVILLSRGFDAKALQGRENLNSKEANEERQALEHGQTYMVDTEARYGSADAMNTLGRMTEVLKRSDVVLHAMDIEGLRNGLDENGERVNSTESLSLLTRDTGGTVFRNTNDLGDSFGRLLSQQEVTYILGFQTSASGAGKFHNLKVKLVNAPEGARITHRQGYYEQSNATVDLDRTLSAGEILTNSLAVDDIRVRAFTAAFPHKDGVAQAPVVLEIDGNSLLAHAKGKTLGAELYVYAFDRQNVVRDYVFQRLGLDTGKLHDKLEAKGVKFYHTLLLPPGDYSVRALVRTEGGSGFTAVPLHVGAAGEPSIAPALLDDNAGWVMVKAPDRQAAPVYPFVAGENVFVPAVVPALQAGKHYELALMTNNVPVERLQVAGKIEGNGTAAQNASLSVLGSTPPDRSGGLKLMMLLTPPCLSPCSSRLVMTIRGGTPPERTVSLPFEVR
jgi:VWFA-related protein